MTLVCRHLLLLLYRWHWDGSHQQGTGWLSANARCMLSANTCVQPERILSGLPTCLHSGFNTGVHLTEFTDGHVRGLLIAGTVYTITTMQWYGSSCLAWAPSSGCALSRCSLHHNIRSWNLRPVPASARTRRGALLLCEWQRSLRVGPASTPHGPDHASAAGACHASPHVTRCGACQQLDPLAGCMLTYRPTGLIHGAHLSSMVSLFCTLLPHAAA